MYLIVNEVELSVNNAYVERNVITNTLSAIIKIPYDSMSFDELKALFMDNTGIITKTNDDGTTESWDGFKYDKPPVDDGVQYRIVLIGEEKIYQIERLRHMEKVLIERDNTIYSKDMEISELNGTISERDKVIAEQEETIVAKDAVISQKDETIEGKDFTIGVKEEEITNLKDTIAEMNIELAELLTIAEEYADMLYAEAIEEMEAETAFEESEVL